MKALTKVLDKVLSTACVVFFALLVVVVVWQVIARQVLNSPAAWTEEVSRYVFVWLGLFATALVFFERGHIAVDFRRPQTADGRPEGRPRAHPGADHRVRARRPRLRGIRAGQGAWNQSLQALPFTLGQMYLVMPVTGVLIAIYAINNIFDVLAGRVTPFAEEIEEDAAQYLEGRVTVETDESLEATREGPPPGSPPADPTDRPDPRS